MTLNDLVEFAQKSTLNTNDIPVYVYGSGTRLPVESAEIVKSDLDPVGWRVALHVHAPEVT